MSLTVQQDSELTIAKNGKAVAYIEASGVKDKDLELANMMAAAPEMLTALEIVETNLKGYEKDLHLKAALDAAKAAIAIAEGKG